MSEILEFIEARYDELEQAANAADAGPWEAIKAPGFNDDWSILGEAMTTARFDPHAQQVVGVPTRREIAGPGYEGGGVWGRANATHIALNDPQFVLDDIAAKRRILNEILPEVRNLELMAQDENDTGEDPSINWHEVSDRLLCALAAPFAAHPDYDPAWTVQ